MNRFRSGMVPLFALMALAGCNSEPTDSIRGDISELVASPTQLFIELGGTKRVEVGAVDEQGNPLDLAYEVTSTGPGITVRRDSSFLPIFVDDTTLQAPATGPRFRFIVEGTGYAVSSFTVSAGGLDIEIPVQVVPQSGLAATFDNPTPALGDTITLTAPAGITFADTANLEIAGNPLIPVIVSQDATTIRFLAPPNVNSPVTVNGVIAATAPTVVFSPATQTALETPVIDTVDVTYSTTTPALGQTVTMTVIEPLINLVVDTLVDTLSGITYPGQLPGRAPGPQNIVVAPDSNSLSFDAPPNADGFGTVVNFAFPGGFLIALPTRPTLTSSNIGTSIPVTTSNTTPAVSEVVTLTAPAGFSFDPATVVTVGANPAIMTSNSGGSVEFVPLPGSIGIPQIDGVVPDAAPANILTMPAEDEVSVPSEVPTLGGTDDPATAPPLTTPDLGELTVLFDNPDFESTIDRFYRIDVPANATFRVVVDWNVGSDVDFFICGDGCDDPFDTDLVQGFTTATPPVPSFFPGATSAHPEQGIYTLTPGTYWLLVEDFGEDAVGTTLTITLRRTS